ncbi:hypothetical protein FRX31_033345, partial [Thalictrum thalictroides]
MAVKVVDCTFVIRFHFHCLQLELESTSDNCKDAYALFFSCISCGTCCCSCKDEYASCSSHQETIPIGLSDAKKEMPTLIFVLPIMGGIHTEHGDSSNWDKPFYLQALGT